MLSTTSGVPRRVTTRVQRGGNTTLQTSLGKPCSSPQAFPIICGRRNRIEYYSSTLSCPVRPHSLTSDILYLFYTLSTWFSVFLSVSFLVLMYILLSTCPSYHFGIFYVILFETGATFTDPLACSFLILSFFVTPHLSVADPGFS